MTRGRIGAARKAARYRGRLHDLDDRSPFRAKLDAAMTEDELLAGITDALTYCGWRWMHCRRSDLAIVQGHQGFPDIVAARDGVLLFLELKREAGSPSTDQTAWLLAIQGGSPWRNVHAAIVRPSTYDATLELIR